MAVTMTACSEDEPVWQPGESSSSTTAAYFSADDPTSIALAEGQASLSVNISRQNATGEATVQLTSTGSSEIFTVPTSVSFAAGEATAAINVGVDFSKVQANDNYPLVIAIAEGDATPYGKSSINISVVYSPWGAWTALSERGVYTLNTPYSGSYEVDLQMRQSKIDPNQVQYRIPADNGSNYALWEPEMIIELDLSTNIVTVPLQLNGDSQNDLPIRYCDSYTLYTKVLNSNNPGQYLGLSNFNPKTGLLTLNIAYFMINGNKVSWWGGAFDNYLQLPGYADYTVEISSNGHWIDDNGVENQILNFYKSADLASVKYEVLQGKVTGDALTAAINALAADGEADELTESGNVAFQLEAGTYTAIAVGMAEGAMQTSASFTFDFESVMVDPNADWNDLGLCKYTDGFVSSWFEIPAFTYAVEVQEHKSEPGVYRLVEPYGQAWPAWDPSIALPGKHYIIINAQDPEGVYVETSSLGIQLNPDYGEFCVSSNAYLTLEDGYSLDAIKAAGLCGVMKDGVITFPARKTLLMSMTLYQGGGWYYSDKNGDFSLDVNGVSPADVATQKASINLNNLQIKDATKSNAKASNSIRGKVVSAEKLAGKVMTAGAIR